MKNNAPPLIVLTRPQAASERFANQCHARFRGRVEMMTTPLLRIAPIKTGLDLSGIGGVIVTSQFAVTALADVTMRRDITLWCVGDQTAQAAADMGFGAQSAQGTVQNLCDLLIAQRPKGPLLYLHGRHITTDLAGILTQAGIPTKGQVIYDQIAQPLPPAFFNALRIRPIIAPLFSSRSARIFAHNIGKAGAGDLYITALSTQIAAALPVELRKNIHIADRPNAPAMLDAMARHRPLWPFGSTHDRVDATDSGMRATIKQGINPI
jgi:uroporphyrinogen-III synthase